MIKLTDEVIYYEFDLTDEAYKIFEDLIVRIEFIVTPGASGHFGEFEVSKLEFDVAAMTIPTYSDKTITPETNLYQGPADVFSFNQHWSGLNYIMKINEQNNYNQVAYSILPGANMSVDTRVEGTFATFDYINFTLKGDEGIKIMMSIEVSKKELIEVIPTYELVLNGDVQQATIYLDELSEQTKKCDY